MKKPVSIAVAAVIFGAAAALAPLSAAHAESLKEALASAYLNNPTLKAQRAAVRAVDESVPQAKSGWRPTVEVTGSIGKAIVDDNTRATGSSDLTPRGYEIQVAQPLFRGFRTEAAVEQAKNSVRSAQAGLQATEQEVLLAAATAYMDVIQAQAVVELTQNNVDVLQRQLDATRDRFRVGEVTRTDVAQGEARVAGAISDRISAESELQSVRATYERVVGAVPGEMDTPPPVANLPGSLREAVELAITSRPSVVSRQYSADAAVHNIDQVRGELLPTVNVIGSYSQNWESSRQGFRSDSASVVVQATVPLYQAGQVYSRLRESKHVAGQRRIEVDEAQFDAREAAVQSWENLAAARAAIESLTAQVEAAQIALEGVQREAQVGARTVLDVLDQEQELLDARVNLVRAQRTEFVAAYQLLASVGRMTVQALELPIEAYDPDAHYLDVRDQWIGGNKWAEDDEELAITGSERGGPMGVQLGE
ncbi:TolC family outer membrane protein [Caenispirillum salinarum]|uniref:TolC family outer membrane protein n=1 Tax=Caenispirillum salinarum TaxID=859058 RepID=UPI00385133D3